MPASSDPLAFRTPDEVSLLLAARVRDLRLAQDWTRATLAARAGIALASLRRLETTGRGSLTLVLRVAHALSRLEEFELLLMPSLAGSLDEFEARAAGPQRRRGRR
jgi:transcriptional regulator with XRE-family HTH domain